MDVDSFIQAAIFLLLLLATAVLSAADMTISPLARSSLEKLRENGTKHADKLLKICHPKQRFYAGIVIGKSLIIIAATAILIIFVEDFLPGFGIQRSAGLVGVVLIIFSSFFFFDNVVAHWISTHRGENSTPRFVLPVYVLFILLTPLIELFYRVLPKEHSKQMKEEELKSIVESESEEGVIEEEEKEMIRSIFEFSDTSVKEVMVPRIDMICAEETISLQELIELIGKSGHSRIPIYKDTVDNIRGVVYAKDLLQILGKSDRWDLEDVMREAYFVPENKKIDEMLQEFRVKKLHMAVVVDEYGGTAGIVTLEDLLEEIVGEIEDEYDTEELLYQWLDEDSLLADARMDIHDLNDLLDTDLPRDGFETLGGFIYDLLGNIPNEGQVIQFKNLQLQIEKVRGQRILKVKIVKKRLADKE